MSSSAGPSSPSHKIIADNALNSKKGLPLDESWYTWSSFFSILTGRATPDETKRYFHARSLRHEAADCARCEQRREWLLEYSPVVRFMRENIQKLGADMDASTIECKRCDTMAAAGPSAGYFNSDRGITLCANHLGTKGHQEDVMAHEMVHAYDYLRFKYDRTNLRHYACTEVRDQDSPWRFRWLINVTKIRASMLSGECRWIREFFNNGQYKFTGHFQDCVKKRAALSVQMSPHCKNEEQAKSVVAEVFESCFADTRPFDEIYR